MRWRKNPTKVPGRIKYSAFSFGLKFRVFWNEKKKKSSTQVSRDNKHLDREKNQLLKLKLFLWPNYRLKDLACMNRYWFDTNNGSRFSMLRVYLYPRLKKNEVASECFLR